jgi:transcriptional regulator NrdR family protein
LPKRDGRALMRCHNCEAKTEVKETRVLLENPRWTKRLRVCQKCGYRLWTIEMPAEDVVFGEVAYTKLDTSDRFSHKELKEKNE